MSYLGDYFDECRCPLCTEDRRLLTLERRCLACNREPGYQMCDLCANMTLAEEAALLPREQL